MQSLGRSRPAQLELSTASYPDRRILIHWIDVFDLLLTRDLSGGHVIDFNPHAPHTDPSLFTYEELHKVLSKAIRDASARWTSLPELRVIGSPLHPAATHKMLAYRHNRLPIEALTLSESRNIMEFGEIWREEVTRAVREDDG